MTYSVYATSRRFPATSPGYVLVLPEPHPGFVSLRLLVVFRFPELTQLNSGDVIKIALIQFACGECAENESPPI